MVEDIPETAPNGPDRRFWSKQPVILDQSDAAVAAAAKEGVIDSSAGKSPSTRPLRLPPNFTWLNLSLDDDNDAHSSGRKSKEEGVNSGQAAAVNSVICTTFLFSAYHKYPGGQLMPRCLNLKTVRQKL
ncbi:MAG: hypothetical protein MHMPM18_001649 [Marteilia pararefringens]